MGDKNLNINMPLLRYFYIFKQAELSPFTINDLDTFHVLFYQQG